MSIQPIIDSQKVTNARAVITDGNQTTTTVSQQKSQKIQDDPGAKYRVESADLDQ